MISGSPASAKTEVMEFSREIVLISGGLSGEGPIVVGQLLDELGLHVTVALIVVIIGVGVRVVGLAFGRGDYYECPVKP